jgi:hypothetical protein
MVLQVPESSSGAATVPTLVEEEGQGLAGVASRGGDTRSERGWQVEEEMRVGERRRVGEMRVGEGRTSARPSSPAAGDGDARVSMRGVVLGRSGTSEKGGASKRSLSSGRGASGTGAARRGGDDVDGGREARRRFGGNDYVPI